MINYLKRYYECIFNFTLFKKYLNEKISLAVLFLIPLFLIFTFQTYFSALEVPKTVVQSMDYYYDMLDALTYDDIIDYGEGEWEHLPTDKVELAFFDNKVQLDQNKVYDTSSVVNGKSYRLILDTKNSLEVHPIATGSYSDQVKETIGFDSAYFVVYVADDFVTVNVDQMIYTRDLSQLDGRLMTTREIYQVSKDNYVPYFSFIIFSLFITFFLYLMYYAVVYFISKSTIKRHGYKLSKGRLPKVCMYSMQPGLYVYMLLTFIMKQTNISISFLVPLIAMIVMSYVASKNLEQLKDYVKKETRKERKESKKGQLQDV